MGFAILTVAAKKARRNKIVEFTNFYGRGDKKLSEFQKSNRINKVLGLEESKKKDVLKQVSFNSASKVDPLKGKDVGNFPLDVRSGTGKHRIIFVQCGDDGSMTIHGMVQDGKEHDLAERKTYSVDFPSDVELKILEQKQFREGKLREVSDRTMVLHDSDNFLNDLFEDEIVDTDEDKEGQV